MKPKTEISELSIFQTYDHEKDFHDRIDWEDRQESLEDIYKICSKSANFTKITEYVNALEEISDLCWEFIGDRIDDSA